MSIIKTIKEYLAVIRIKPNDIGVKIQDHSITNEDESVAATRNRVNKTFDQQAKQMQARALKPHAVNCKDMLKCRKKVCFVWEPDKIVEIDSIKSIDIEEDDKTI